MCVQYTKTTWLFVQRDTDIIYQQHRHCMIQAAGNLHYCIQNGSYSLYAPKEFSSPKAR